MQAIRLLILGFLLGAPAAPAFEGGEIGNAFVPFESKIGGYELVYPRHWRRTDLSQVTSFADPNPAVPDKPDFLAVITNRMDGVVSPDTLLRHLRFFRPEVSWQATTFAGLEGFIGEIEGVPTLYLLRGPEDLISVRYRANENEQSEQILSFMLASFRVH